MENLIDTANLKQSDIDNNLSKYQQLNIDEFVEGIILSCAGNAIVGDDIHSPKGAFRRYIQGQQAEMDAKCKTVGSKDMYVNLSKITWKFCKGFIDRYDHAEAKRINKQKIMDEFKQEFKKRYIDLLFTPDSSAQGNTKNN